jgi:RNA polymerase sigma-70 factor (ECF subfamily)
VNVVKEDDAQIVKSILAGNLDDFRKLWDKYQLDAKKWAFYYVRNSFEAEDVAQEAFMETYFRLSTLKKPHKFGGWLRRIVTNIAVSRLRRRRETVVVEEVNGIISNGKRIQINNRYEVPTPDDLVEQQEQHNRLQVAINALSPEYRSVITMFYFDNHSIKEIASQLGISVAAVKVILFRARQQLKKEILKDE